MADRGMMGGLASMGDYAPGDFADTLAERFPADDWTYRPPMDANEAAAMRLARPYAKANAARMSEDHPVAGLAEGLAPKEPWQYGLMFAGPGAGWVGRGISQLPAAARLGAAAMGFTLGLPGVSDQAQGAKLPRVPKVMGSVARTADDLPGVKNWTPPFPQYAEKYPEIGPGTPAIDPQTKREYLAKELTPEAVAFQKARAKIMLDMEKNGYQPYFDVSKREHVDPANYPPNVDTTTIIPKKQATIDKHMENIGTEDARARLRAAYQRGTELPNTADWYALKQLEDEFIKELGPDAGRKAFQDRIATSMAATTGGADPTSNWLMATYGNYLRTKGLPYPEAAHEMPFPIGGRYASGNMAMHKKIFDEGGFAALGEGNPKRHNFSQNFTGNRGAATMDEQMTSGMTPGVNMPPAGTYGLYEKVLGEEAAKVGVQPQNYQDVGWAGFKNLKDPKYTSGEPFIQTVNESIERTHRLTGMPKDEILKRGIIKGEIPLYAVMGAVGLGALADQKGYAP